MQQPLFLQAAILWAIAPFPDSFDCSEVTGMLLCNLPSQLENLSIQTEAYHRLSNMPLLRDTKAFLAWQPGCAISTGTPSQLLFIPALFLGQLGHATVRNKVMELPLFLQAGLLCAIAPFLDSDCSEVTGMLLCNLPSQLEYLPIQTEAYHRLSNMPPLGDTKAFPAWHPGCTINTGALSQLLLIPALFLGKLWHTTVQKKVMELPFFLQAVLLCAIRLPSTPSIVAR